MRGKLNCLCPFHEERTPSFWFTLAGKYQSCGYCFGCGHKADVIGLYQHVYGLSFRDAAHDLASRFAPWLVEGSPVGRGVDPAPYYPQPPPKTVDPACPYANACSKPEPTPSAKNLLRDEPGQCPGLHSALGRYLVKLFGAHPNVEALVAETMRAYRVFSDVQGRTLFCQTTLEGETLRWQCIAYDEHTGKRRKDRPPITKPTGQPGAPFGTHLLLQSKHPVLVAESPKTALVGALSGCFYLETGWACMAWLALCGSQNHSHTQRELVKLERNRPLRLLADNDEAGGNAMQKLAAWLKAEGFVNVRTLSVLGSAQDEQPAGGWPKGTDLADIACSLLPA